MIKGYEEFASFGKANVEAWVQSSTLAAKGAEELVKAFVALGGQHVAKTAAVAKAMAGVKSPAELMQLQVQLAHEGVEGAMSEAQKLAAIVNTVVASAIEPLEARAKAAADLYRVAA